MLLFVNISGVWEYYMFDECRVHSFQRESYDLFDLLKEFNSIFICSLLKDIILSQVWCHKFVIPALRPEDHKLKASLNSTTRPCLNKTKQTQNHFQVIIEELSADN